MGRHVARDTPAGLETVDDKEAPWGRRLDGTPKARPGRKKKSDREKAREDSLRKAGHDVSLTILNELQKDPDAVANLRKSSPSVFASLVGNVVGKVLPRVLDAKAADDSAEVVVQYENRWQQTDPPEWFKAKHKKKTPESVRTLWQKKLNADAEAAYEASVKEAAEKRVERESGDAEPVNAAIVRRPSVADLLAEVREQISGNSRTMRNAIVKYADEIRIEDEEVAAREQAKIEQRKRNLRLEGAIARWDDRMDEEDDIIDAEWRLAE